MNVFNKIEDEYIASLTDAKFIDNADSYSVEGGPEGGRNKKHKELVNTSIASALQKILSGPRESLSRRIEWKPSALILDGSSGGTSQKILDIGLLSPANIIVPNPHKNVVDQLKSNLKVNALTCDVETFLEKQDKYKIDKHSLIYLDFTGSMLNHINTVVDSFDSLDFDNTPSGEAIIGFTFSTRDSRQGSEWNRGKCIYHAVKTIKDAAEKRGLLITGLRARELSDFILFPQDEMDHPIKKIAKNIYEWTKLEGRDSFSKKFISSAVEVSQYFCNDNSAQIVSAVFSKKNKASLAVLGNDGSLHDKLYKQLLNIGKNISEVYPQYTPLMTLHLNRPELRVFFGSIHIYEGQMATLLFTVCKKNSKSND